jgi:hypothetical protein
MDLAAIVEKQWQRSKKEGTQQKDWVRFNEMRK